MTLLFMEGFEHYTYAQMADKGWGAAIGSISNVGRFGGNAFASSSASAYLSRDLLLSGVDTLYLGFAFNKNAGYPGEYSFNYYLVNFQDESGVSQVRVYVNPANGITVRDGAGTILGTSADGIIVNFKYHYIEIKVVVSATVGEVIVKIDETEVLNLTNQDTKNGSDYLSRIGFKNLYVNISSYFDDIYVDDAQFHGDCQVKTFFPDLDGNSSDLTRSAGSNDYECVDDNPSNEDTDYISSDTLNHKSIFGITTGALATVKGIQVNNHCRKDAAGSRKITPIIRSNSVDYQGTESEVISDSYFFEHEVWELDPDDSAVWDQTKLEAAEFGLEITT